MKNITLNVEISQDVNIADNYLKRLKGLMFTSELSPQSSLYIYPCSGVHTYFMNYSIDVLYLDKDNIIIAVDEDMKPGRLGKYHKNAVAAVELPSGRIRETRTKVGHAIILI